MTAIDSFRGEFQFLSNFYRVDVEYDGMEYATVEHAYQAAKTTEPRLREKIQNTQTPVRAKMIGKQVPLREGWDQMKDAVMRELLERKFSLKRYPILAQSLLDTGSRVLIEGNTWGDRYWGCVLDENGAWDGENMLGVLLMYIRAELVLQI